MVLWSGTWSIHSLIVTAWARLSVEKETYLQPDEVSFRFFVHLRVILFRLFFERRDMHVNSGSL